VLLENTETLSELAVVVGDNDAVHGRMTYGSTELPKIEKAYVQ